jgi:hypothetical protein
MNFKNKKALLLFSAIIAGFFIFTNTEKVFASGPYISSFILNGSPQNISFNPQNGEKANIAIITNTPVKFNTIAICLNTDDICSRTTAVKYFTQTSSYSTSVSKDWDGKTGGSSPSLVSEGEYKIKATMADASGGSSTEVGQYLILVNFSSGNSSTTNNSTTSSSTNGTNNTSTSTNNNSTTTSQNNNSTSTTNTIIKTYTRTVYISTHSGPDELSDFNEKSSFITSAGRERLSYVGTPVEFSASYKMANSNANNASFEWSYGDGFNDSGQKVSHIYKHPGEYNIVLNGNEGEDHSVSRTKITILTPQISISQNQNAIDISNDGKSEINLGDWKLTNGFNSFIFSPDTIIDSGKKLSLSAEDTKINIGSSTIYLENPSGGEVVVLNPNMNNTDSLKIVSGQKPLEEVLGMSIENAENIVNKYRKSLVLSNPIIESLPEVSAPSSNLDKNNLQNVASVGEAVSSTTSNSFFGVIFNMPIRALKAIGGLFYNF